MNSISESDSTAEEGASVCKRSFELPRGKVKEEPARGLDSRRSLFTPGCASVLTVASACRKSNVSKLYKNVHSRRYLLSVAEWVLSSHPQSNLLPGVLPGSAKGTGFVEWSLGPGGLLVINMSIKVHRLLVSLGVYTSRSIFKHENSHWLNIHFTPITHPYPQSASTSAKAVQISLEKKKLRWGFRVYRASTYPTVWEIAWPLVLFSETSFIGRKTSWGCEVSGWAQYRHTSTFKVPASETRLIGASSFWEGGFSRGVGGVRNQVPQFCLGATYLRNICSKIWSFDL